MDQLHIHSWRNFRDLTLPIPEGALLVCLVGDNGTGKSNVLELIAALSHQFGLAPGVDTLRGNPLGEPHDVQARLTVPDGFAKPLIDLADPAYQELAKGWDNTLTITSTRSAAGNHSLKILAGGVEPARAEGFAQQTVQILRHQEGVHHVHIDAERGPTAVALDQNKLLQAFRTDWNQPGRNKDKSFRPTKTLFEDWLQYLIGAEAQAADEHMRACRLALEQDDPQPAFVEPFAAYVSALQEVLPHLRFRRIDRHKRTVIFDSAGEELEFAKLSGGERELAFLVAQIVRFGLRDGLFLLDEPELHLNPSLLRNWLQFVAGTTSRCQIWVATHSWEAAETIGPSGTIVLEREPDTRIVSRATLMESRPVIRVLSSAVGSPAFSIASQRFVYVEGDGTGAERGRFASLCGNPARDRFIEGGNCTQVAAKVKVVEELAGETDERLFVGGVLDRDFRSDAELAPLRAEDRLHVLPCHEVENLLLHRETLELLLQRDGRGGFDVLSLLTEVSDQFAGRWILQRAATLTRGDGKPSREVRRAAGGTPWQDVQNGWGATRDAWLGADGAMPPEYAAVLSAALDAAHASYLEVRNTEALFGECFGKEVFGAIAPRLGIQNAAALERRVLGAWRNGEVAEPEGVIALREFVAGLAPV